MSTKAAYIAGVLMLAVAFGAGAFLYPQLPEMMASHWNMEGQVDGYTGRFVGAFLLPIITTLLLVVMMVLPLVDPLKKNIESFRRQYNLVIIGIAGFLIFVHGLSLVWNLGMRFPFGGIISFAIAALFILIGVLMPRMKRNWFMGVRTPWTLSSDKVWEKTHRLSGMLFVASGILVAVASVVRAEAAIGILLISILTASVASVAYSYIAYKREASGD